MIIQGLNTVLMKHSKWLFAIFTAVIIIAFVWFFTPGVDGSLFFGGGSNGKYGTIFDEPVTYEQLADFADLFDVYGAVVQNRPLGSNSLNDDAAEQAFYFMALDNAAKRAGITATKQEMSELLASLPQFQENGKFSPDKYNTFFEKYLAPAGCTQKTVEDSLALSVRLQKFGEHISQNVVVTDLDMRDFMNEMLKKIHVRKVVFDTEAVRAKVDVGGDVLKTYFEANADKFVTQPVSTGILAYIPLTEAEKKDDKAANAAKDKAIAFFRGMRALSKEPEYGDKYMELFRQNAAKGGLQMMELKGITPVSEPVQFIEADLIRALTTLKNVSSITNVVEGKNGFYVAMLTSRVDSHTADFEDVKADVEKAYREERTMTLCKEAAANLRAKLQESAAPAKDLENLAKAAGAQVSAAPDVSQIAIQEGMKDSSKFGQDSYFVSQLAFKTEDGLLSSEVFYDKSCMMVFVDGHTYPTDEECQKGITDEFREICLSLKREQAMREYQNWIFSNVKKFTQKQEN